MKPLKVIFLLLCLANSITVFAQEDWKLSVDKDDIKIYTRPLINSKINALKVEFNLPVSSSRLLALLMDINNSNQWLFHCKTSRIIKTVNPNELFYYTEVSVPWPAKNRDFVSHLVMRQNPQTKIITIDAPAVKGMVPEKDNTIRITQSSSRWTVIPLSATSTKVTYELAVDPEGSTPAWLINLFATQGPLQTFKNLKIQIQKAAYKNAG